ncbi:hypothetical protein PSECIP111854_02851 [Pseudoalteromonas sp. CIP111854]|uniref:Tetratricopeptide repeat protein n=1 Tax=Pseudoalteromonas holothuriae TaxID=2963714 RepID=A0A9W4R118_9GAMM|nr:tetratricopeptide repeat protein [Pseudoalteromonas sp. CIP111854]CAH9061637.1 hypothetical protein PSECIP111854_02851 [Pseudoalteromonas sp. CIP111854]
MNISRTEKLMSFWLNDKKNELLLQELLTSISQHKEFEIYAKAYSEIPFDQIKSQAVHASAVELLIQSGQTASAKQHLVTYQLILSQWCIYFNALIQFKESNFDGCIETFSNFPADSKILAMTYTLCARAHYMSGEIELAKLVLDKYITNHVNAEALGLYAMCWLDLGNYEHAEEFANNAIQEFEYQLDALLALASCALAKHEIALAEKYVGKCLQINPYVGRVWSLAGQIDLYHAQYNNAVIAFEKAVTFMPNHIGTYHLLAWTYLIIDELEKAELQFQSALELNPSFADSHAGLAIIELNREKLDEANKLIKKSLRLDPNSFTAHYAQSLLSAKNGNEASAKQMIERILNSKSHVNELTYQQLIEKSMKIISERSGKYNEH